jgi:uncharacterized membrane protein YphA (DoxX/SURF4 family)
MDATRYLPFAGRLLIGLPFAMSGLGKLAAYGPTTAMIAAAGLPVPPLAYLVAVELGGGILLIAGFGLASSRPRWCCSRSPRRYRSTATSPTRTR